MIMSIRRLAHSTFRLSIVLALVLFLIVAHHRLSSHGGTVATPQRPKLEVSVEGRWKAVRDSLGLPPLSDQMTISSNSTKPYISPPPRRLVPESPSRFDLKRKRSEFLAQKQKPVELYFAADVETPGEDSSSLLASLHAIVLVEKEKENRPGRGARPQGLRNRQPQRPNSSWMSRGKNVKALGGLLVMKDGT